MFDFLKIEDGQRAFLFCAVAVLALGLVFSIGYSESTVKKTSPHEVPPSEWGSPPTSVIEEGSMVEYADFVVFENEGGDYIYAKSGKTGEIVYSGSDDNRVISDVIDNASPGGIVFFKNGTYEVDGLRSKTGVYMLGSSESATKFVTSSTYAIVMDGISHSSIRRVTIEGGGINMYDLVESTDLRHITIQSVENGIRICNSQDIRAHEITIDNFSDYAVCMGNDPTSANASRWLDFADITIRNPQPSVEMAVHISGEGQPISRSSFKHFDLSLEGDAEDGLHVENTSENGDIIFNDWYIEGASDGGVLIEWAPYHLYQDVNTSGAIEGFKIENSHNTRIQHCGRASGADYSKYGIHIQDSDDCLIDVTTFHDVDNRGIWAERCEHLTISNNILYGSQYGIVTENCTGTIAQNNVQNNTVQPIMRLDSDMDTTANPGYVLENSGTFIMNNKTRVVDHGLDEIPDIVNVQPRAEVGKVFYVTNINTDNFTIGTGTAPTDAEIQWEAEAY